MSEELIIEMRVTRIEEGFGVVRSLDEPFPIRITAQHVLTNDEISFSVSPDDSMHEALRIGSLLRVTVVG